MRRIDESPAEYYARVRGEELTLAKEVVRAHPGASFQELMRACMVARNGQGNPKTLKQALIVAWCSASLP